MNINHGITRMQILKLTGLKIDNLKSKDNRKQIYKQQQLQNNRNC